MNRQVILDAVIRRYNYRIYPDEDHIRLVFNGRFIQAGYIGQEGYVTTRDARSALKTLFVATAEPHDLRWLNFTGDFAMEIFNELVQRACYAWIRKDFFRIRNLFEECIKSPHALRVQLYSPAYRFWWLFNTNVRFLYERTEDEIERTNVRIVTDVIDELLAIKELFAENSGSPGALI